LSRPRPQARQNFCSVELFFPQFGQCMFGPRFVTL
jgi:hypothetical protein